MNGRMTTGALWVGVAALALTDWMVGGSIAQPRPGHPEPATPARAPAGSDLTQELSAPADLGGVRVTIEQGSNGKPRLRAVSSIAEPKRVAFTVECWDRVGSAMSRMGPIPRQVASERVELVVAAHATVVRELAMELPPLPPGRGPAARTGDDGSSNANANDIGMRLGRMFRSDALIVTRELRVIQEPGDARPRAQARPQAGPALAERGELVARFAR